MAEKLKEEKLSDCRKWVWKKWAWKSGGEYNRLKERSLSVMKREKEIDVTTMLSSQLLLFNFSSATSLALYKTFMQLVYALFRVLEVITEVKWMKRLNIQVPNTAVEIFQQVTIVDSSY